MQLICLFRNKIYRLLFILLEKVIQKQNENPVKKGKTLTCLILKGVDCVYRLTVLRK